MNTWTFSPQSGGTRIPPSKQAEVRQRLERYAARNYTGRYSRLDIRFRGALCYMDAYQEPKPLDRRLLDVTGESEEEYFTRMRNTPIHLGRLRYFGADRWSYAFYTYSHERYEPAFFPSGEWFGSPEEAMDVGAMYLDSERC